jgi:hypothetical protein
MSLYNVAAWLEKTPWSVALHESIWAYPIIESVHVLFLCLFLGMAIALYLRLIGVSFKRGENRILAPPRPSRSSQRARHRATENAHWNVRLLLI